MTAESGTWPPAQAGAVTVRAHDPVSKLSALCGDFPTAEENRRKAMRDLKLITLHLERCSNGRTKV